MAERANVGELIREKDSLLEQHNNLQAELEGIIREKDSISKNKDVLLIDTRKEAYDLKCLISKAVLDIQRKIDTSPAKNEIIEMEPNNIINQLLSMIDEILDRNHEKDISLESISGDLRKHQSSLQLFEIQCANQFLIFCNILDSLISKFSLSEGNVSQTIAHTKLQLLEIAKSKDLFSDINKDVDDPDRQEVLLSMESQLKAQTETIKGFELALLEAQKYMDEKELLAEKKSLELATVQGMNEEVNLMFDILDDWQA